MEYCAVCESLFSQFLTTQKNTNPAPLRICAFAQQKCAVFAYLILLSFTYFYTGAETFTLINSLEGGTAVSALGDRFEDVLDTVPDDVPGQDLFKQPNGDGVVFYPLAAAGNVRGIIEV